MGFPVRDVCRSATAKGLFTSTFMALTGDFSRSIVDLTRTNVRAPMTYSVRWHGKLGRRAWVSCRLAVSRPPVINARDSARSTRVGDCLQVSRPQREGELFCLDLLRPEPHGTKTVRPTLSSEQCRTGLTYVGCQNPPRTQHKGRRAAEIVPNQRISVTPTNPNTPTTGPSSTGDRGSSTRSGMAFAKSAPDASYRELLARSKIRSR